MTLARPPAGAVAPARRCAYEVIRRVFEQGAYADRALHAQAGSLDARDRALATALAYGTVQRARTIDHLLAPLVSRDLARLDPPILAALRLGVFQLAFLGGIAEHAAVNESVELAKGSSRGGASMVNAVLRRAAREGRERLAELDDDTPEHAAVLHSVPDWIAQLWWKELGADDARALLKTVNEPAESALRINALNAATDIELPVRSHPAEELPEGRVLDEPFDVFGSPQFENGLVMPQSRASMLVSRTLDPGPGTRTLDLCAAPGGKTTHLAALKGGEGEIVAVEVHPGRARALERTCERMGAINVRVLNRDGREINANAEYDDVLVDPPCSGLGTLQSRPDLRWQQARADLEALALRQAELLRAGAQAARPGGAVVYSVCTISRREGEGVVEPFLDEHPEFTLESQRRLLPHRDHTDGFYIARIVRR